MREKLRQFMIGRYGTDGLNQFLSIASLVLLLIAIISRVSLFTYLGAALLIFCYYRTFSRNISKRTEENYKFYTLIDTYLIQPFYKKEAEAKDAEIRVAKDGDTFNFDNDELDDDDDDKPQYVYVNGRLIDRKIMEQESLFSDKTDTSDHLQ